MFLDFDKEVHYFPLEEERDFSIDVPRLIKAATEVEADGLVIVNPNTPTGQRTPLDDRLLILDALQRLDIVIVDESFIEFSDVDRADFLSMSRSSGVGKNLLDRSRNR